jgi:predicted outer membrane repeat protein
MKIHLSTTLRIFVVILLALGMTSLPNHSARADTCTVTTNADSGPGSLREKIDLDACTTINFDGDYTILLGSTLPDLYRMLTISGAGHDVILDGGGGGGGGVRIFNNHDSGATLEHLTLQNGRADSGGAIYNAGTLTVTDSLLQGNSATGTGGAIYSYAGTLTIMDSSLQDNYAGAGGAGIYIQNASLDITHVLFKGNQTDNAGGGILYSSTSGAPSYYNLTVTQSTFDSNIASYGGAGIEINTGEATVTNSTFTGNNSPNGGTGAGIENYDSLTVANSTFQGNTAYFGGGILNGASLNLTSSTFSENTASSSYGNDGADITNWGTLNFANTIMANATAGWDCINDGGTIDINTDNLVEDGSCSTSTIEVIGFQHGEDPNLGDLAYNGGQTRTMALRDPSPAIDAGDDGICAAAPVSSLDQRGASRSLGLHCDIGAFEYIPPVDCTVTSTADSGAGSLRAQVANSSCSTITFDPVLSGSVITLVSQLELQHDLKVDGSALGYQASVSGNDQVRVLQMDSGVTATWDSVDIKNGYAEDGANIYNQGNLTLKNTLVYKGDATFASGGGYGGGIYNDTGANLDLQNSSVSGNGSYYGGGGIYNKSTLTVSGSTFSDNRTVGSGAGIGNYDGTVTVTDSTLQNNSSGSNGGGIVNDGGTLTINGSTFSLNSASSNGGGIYNSGIMTVDSTTFDQNRAGGSGGGIATYSSTSSVTSSTLYGNYTDGTYSVGGGIEIIGGILNVTNSTLVGNTTIQWGGGIANYATLNLKNSTLSDNTAHAFEGGGIANMESGATLNYANTIIANSTAGGDCVNDGGAIGTSTNNWVEDHSCSSTFFGDPNLATLADNGGPTWTMALPPGSPAIDAGDNVVCAAAPVNNLDQRGVIRPQGAHCDIGAFEVQKVLLAVPGGQSAGLCESPANACELRYALTAAVAGQEIHAAVGTYTPTAGTDRTLTFLLKDGVALYGGFPIGFDADSRLAPDLRGLPDATILSGEIGAAVIADNSYHVLTVAAGTAGASLDDVTITGGNANGGGDYANGGGLYNKGNLTVTDVTFSGNSASYDGGGIYNASGTSLHVMGSNFNGNKTVNGGGGGGAINNQATLEVRESTFSNNQADIGGAIRNELGDLRVKSSTLSGNQATDRGGAIGSGYGTLIVSNSTLQGNSATQYGGAIYHDYGSMWIVNSTLSGNSVSPGAGHWGGGIADQHADTFYLANTIIANSLNAEDCHTQLATVYTNINNLVEDGSCSAGGVNFHSGDPLLGPLVDNGGPTQTLALLSGSSAINAGDDGICTTDPVNGVDQRGVIRPQGLHCDMGAYELYGLPLVTGWNLVSFNLNPVDTAIASVLASLGDQYSLVYAWDATASAWRIYDPTLGALNDLQNLDETMGFWIKMNADKTLVINGTVPGSTNIDLKNGWNLVGYPSASNGLLPEVLSNHGVGAEFSLVYAYHASDGSAAWKLYDRTENPLLNDLTELSPGWGYWIKTSAEPTWTIP